MNRHDILAVAFLASWCPFCTRFQSAFEAAANESGITWEIADISHDDNVLWERFGIEIVPTVIIFKEGKAVWRKDGIRGRGLSADAVQETIYRVKSLRES